MTFQKFIISKQHQGKIKQRTNIIYQMSYVTCELCRKRNTGDTTLIRNKV